MEIYISTLAIISTSIMSFIFLKCYENISDIKIDKRYLFLIVISGILCTLNTYFNPFVGYFNKAISSFIILLLLCWIVFKEDFKTTFIKCLICYFISVIMEILLSVFILLTKYVGMENFKDNINLKALFSLLIFLLTLLILKIKFIKKFCSIIVKVSQKEIVSFILILISSFTSLILAFKYAINSTKTMYYENIILLVIFTIIISIGIYTNYKAKKEVEKTEVLLDFMSKYEKIIDDDRINRHEMLNNLLLLKSIKNKNTSNYENTLDSLIELYGKNKDKIINNIHKLPSGLKGIIYYKISDMKKVKINVSLNISKQANLDLKSIKCDDYIVLCKIITTLLDNAKEAAQESKNKYVLIEINNELNNTIISIHNSTKKDVDISKIENKNYTTKGKNRGLGLYLVNLMLRKTDNIKVNYEYTQNIFTTNVRIENKKTDN